jgi:hypothetical protein
MLERLSPGVDVKLIDQYPLYELGAALQQLKDAISNEGGDALDKLMALFTADNNVRLLLEGIQWRFLIVMTPQHA